MSKKTPLKAIRLKCLECSGEDPQMVESCEIADCPLFPYRFGKNPDAPLYDMMQAPVNDSHSSEINSETEQKESKKERPPQPEQHTLF